MNVFEFLLVIVSIMLGLGITELLAGLVRVLRGELVTGKLHALWMFVVFQLQVQLAWGLWGLRSKVEWQYPEFLLLLLLLAPVLLYLAAAVIIRLPAVAILATLAVTERPRLHLVLGLVVLALQLWFTYLFTFVVGATAAAA
jgi:hypothetical protein